MRRFPLLAALGTAALLATTAHASGPGEAKTEGTAYLPNGTMSYAVFETAVDHADLEGCPVEFDTEQNFCRLTLVNEQAHVFVFSYDGDQPLLAVKSYDLGDGFLPF